MRLSLIVSLLIAFALPGLAQHGRLNGTVADTAENHPLVKSVIMILQQKDSFLVAFARADDKGEYVFHNLPRGKLILKASYPGYADYVLLFELKDSTEDRSVAVPLIRKSKLLEEVVVRGNMAAIKMNGDTLEFRADSFRVQQGATVEELLKKLPGIQVDHNGKITAQGETVKKVLVDGEEFFGDDPTLVTQNLRADMVDKVQVFDKKSDQAAFTGIDDGEKSKTINLQLKANKKKGYFGKLEGGLGSNGFFNNQAMYNLFKNKLKFSVYGIWSNTGKTGLNWQENDKFGQSFASSVDYDEMNGYSFTGSEDDLESWNGQYGGQGLPVVKTGGIHFNNKWDADKQSVNANYKILDLDVTGTTGSRTQYLLPDSVYYNNASSSFHNHILRNKGSLIYETALDSTSSIKLNLDAGIDHKTTQTAYSSDFLDEDSALVNRNNRTVTTTGDLKTVNANLIYRKKFSKKGRSLTFNVRDNYSDDDADGYLHSDTRYYKKDSLSSVALIDQFKTFRTLMNAYDTRLTYIEPLSKLSAMAVNYGVSGGSSHSQRTSLNNDGQGKYDDLDSLYSNNYRFSLFTQRMGLLYNYTGKKLKVNFGNNWGFTGFKQRDIDNDSVLQRHFVNWYPQARLNYRFSQSSGLWLNYEGSTNQPTITQLQPLANNQDPLNVVIGNPRLRPEFRNNIYLRYNMWKDISRQSLNFGVNGSKTANAISSRDDVDSLGRRIIQSINVNGNYDVNGYVNYEQKLFWDIIGGAGLNYNGSRYKNIVNSVLNQTDQQTYGFQASLSRSKDKKYDLGVRGEANYTSSKSSVQNSINTHYWTLTFSPNTDIFFPAKFQLHTEADILLRQKTSVFDKKLNTVFWNAWFGKKFFKAENLLIKIQANDILNQNIGFNRSVNSNYIAQNTYTTIRRYFMLTAVWNFTKAAAAPAKP